MKKIIFLVFLSILFISLINATSCTPPSGYQYCEENYGSSLANGVQAHAKVFWAFTDDRGILIPNNIALKHLYYKAGMITVRGICPDGTNCIATWRLYKLLNSPSWPSCTSSGCSGTGLTTLTTSGGLNGPILLASTGQTYTDCLAFENFAKIQDFTSGAYSWASAGIGWPGSGNCLSIRVVDCISSTDCLSGQTCVSNACQACTENWQCGAWSTCSGGTQTRTCTDLNSCGTTTTKPATSQTCCVPQTCTTLGKTCGSWSDGCTGTLTCGVCSTNTGYTCNVTGQCQYAPTYARYQINILNNGGIPYDDIKLTSTTPDFLSYFPVTTIFSLGLGQSANFTSSMIDVAPYLTQTFFTYLSALNTYTNQTETFSASKVIP